jgi:hypothetical protein
VLQILKAKSSVVELDTVCRRTWLGLNTPHTRTIVKTLKLAIRLFLEFWLQIWFQKYYISTNGTQFLINKHKNRGRFLFTFPDLVAHVNLATVQSFLSYSASIPEIWPAFFFGRYTYRMDKWLTIPPDLEPVIGTALALYSLYRPKKNAGYD